jgi:hypothetical protein
MDPLLTALLVRFFERITVVLIGGMAIYLGFRLFREVPEQRDSAGKLVLPWDISIMLTRVGPGVFFALFGVAAVSLALARPLELTPAPAAGPEVSAAPGKLAYASRVPATRDARANARSEMRGDISVLNSLPKALRQDLGENDREKIERAVRNTKLRAMLIAWGDRDEGFGDFATFETWAKSGEPNPPPSGMDGALALYRWKDLAP